MGSLMAAYSHMDEVLRALAPEQVAVESEPCRRLSYHDDLEPGGMTGSLISQGWPRALANLKTLLETGDTLPDHSRTRRPGSV
jgi:hypothetical protein